jgi:hypothetical protein
MRRPSEPLVISRDDKSSLLLSFVSHRRTLGGMTAGSCTEQTERGDHGDSD